MTPTPKKQYFDYETSIYEGGLYFEDCLQAEVDSDEFADIIDHKTVYTIRVFSLSKTFFERVWVDGIGLQKELIDTELTLRKEVRSGRSHWYAYRRVLGKLHKKYVGASDRVTQERLLEICQSMPTVKIGLIKE